MELIRHLKHAYDPAISLQSLKAIKEAMKEYANQMPSDPGNW